MLKIWLTWLQPGVGMLGTALVLSNPLSSYAATKPVTVRNSVKTPIPISQWSTAKTNGTSIDRELLTGIAATPDLAVRQLAVNSMGASGVQAVQPKPKVSLLKRMPISSFTTPSTKSPKLSTRVTKLNQSQKNSDVAAAIARAINPQTSPTLTGLYIGGTNVRTANKFVPSKKTVAAEAEIGSPTSLSAMMAAKTTIDPFPVVRPEMMQKLGRMPVNTTASAIKTAPDAINPIASIPNGKRFVAPKVAAPTTKAKATTQAQAVPYQSLDPIAAIPSGLQRLLGNNLSSRQTIAAVPVTKKVASKPNPMLAVQQFVSPAVATVPSVNGASLRLATAQAYTNVPKFSIPGEKLLAAKQLKPSVNMVAIKRVRQNFTAPVDSRKSNYITTLAPANKQSWTMVGRRNNLGGLILGSQPLVSVPNVASLLPEDTSTSAGPKVKSLLNVN